MDGTQTNLVMGGSIKDCKAPGGLQTAAIPAVVVGRSSGINDLHGKKWPVTGRFANDHAAAFTRRGSGRRAFQRSHATESATIIAVSTAVASAVSGIESCRLMGRTSTP